MEQDQLFERLWNGAAPMEAWTEAVSDGAVTAISENIISVHTTYFCGSVTVIRTTAGLVLIDTAKPDTAGKTLAAVRHWDNSPIHTVIYTQAMLTTQAASGLSTRRLRHGALRGPASSLIEMCCAG